MTGEDNVNNSRLYIALALLVAIAAAVVLTRRAHESQTGLEKPSQTLPAVDKSAATQFELSRPGQPTIVAQKQGDKWSITAPLQAEASQEAVNGALDKLADLKVTGLAATRKENQARLGVDAAHALHVRVKAGEKQLLDLYVGEAKGASTIVREEGKDAALSVKGSIRYAFDKDLKEFRKREITDLDVTQVSALAISSKKGNFKFERGPADAWTQAKGEKPIAKFDPEQVQSLLSTATHLRAADFAAAGEPDAVTGLDAPSAKLTLTKKDASTLELSIGKQHPGSDDFYVRSSESPVVFRVAKFSAERLMPEAKYFEKVEKPAQAAAPQGMQQGMPPGMQMGGPGGGQGGITPEMMEQIQRQLAAQGQGHP
ncbi:MAG: hypothetical protein JWN04_2322 [Myxococcaceae bacterium]|nr:hypothetical protein [Myxococcaceae bacterium]